MILMLEIVVMLVVTAMVIITLVLVVADVGGGDGSEMIVMLVML